MSLARFMETIKEILKGKNEIVNFLEYEKLMKELYKKKLITIADTTSIKESTMIFPLTIEHFINFLADSFSIDLLKDFDYLLSKFHKQLEDCKNTLTYWNKEGFTNEELKGLLLVYEKIQLEFKGIKKEYKEINETIQNISEPINRLKDQIEDNAETKIKTSFTYIEEENFSIEKEYFSMRVRDAHYRNQPITMIKHSSNEIIKQMGYCIDKDFPIEVVKIPRNFMDFQNLEKKLNTFTALKQLIFSKYFQKYLGFNSLSDQNYNLYFFDCIKGHSLENIFFKNKVSLHENSGIFSYWMRELFVAFRDILEKTYYEPVLPIKMKHIYTTDDGLKIFIKNISFSQIRTNSEEAHGHLEASLLKNYGIILLQLLGIDSEDDDEDYLKNYNLDANLQNFIDGLLSAPIDLNSYLKKEIKRRLCFADLLHHTILQEKYLLEIDACEIANDFIRLLDNPVKSKNNL